ncbi:hypothetical protein QFC20_002885 [Naganishia adeliensis]|uniref:Uncharacterized protein n=1 Tax=Naganishia adeliensis TaxID=92952 RepID=A0ACC2WGL8_9TREE|nr:hypothetical protein QFC20_002885 [Naganishia adeliensis]
MPSIRSSSRRSSSAQKRARSDMPTPSKRAKLTPTLDLSARPVAPFPLAATFPIPDLGTLLEGSPAEDHEMRMKEVLEMGLAEDEVNEVNESARVRLVWETFGALFDGSGTGNRRQQGYANENPALYGYALDSLQYYAQHVCQYEQRLASPSSPPLIQFKHINSEATPYILKLRRDLGNGFLQVLMTGGNPWVASSARRMWRKLAECCDEYGSEVVVEGVIYGIACRIIYGPRKGSVVKGKEPRVKEERLQIASRMLCASDLQDIDDWLKLSRRTQEAWNAALPDDWKEAPSAPKPLPTPGNHPYPYPYPQQRAPRQDQPAPPPPSPVPASAPASVPAAQLGRSLGHVGEDLEKRKDREDEDEDVDEDEMDNERDEMDDSFQDPEDVDQALDLDQPRPLSPPRPLPQIVPVVITPTADARIRELEVQLAATQSQLQDVKQERNEALQTLGRKDLLLEQVQERLLASTVPHRNQAVEVVEMAQQLQELLEKAQEAELEVQRLRERDLKTKPGVKDLVAHAEEIRENMLLRYHIQTLTGEIVELKQQCEKLQDVVAVKVKDVVKFQKKVHSLDNKCKVLEQAGEDATLVNEEFQKQLDLFKLKQKTAESRLKQEEAVTRSLRARVIVAEDRGDRLDEDASGFAYLFSEAQDLLFSQLATDDYCQDVEQQSYTVATQAGRECVQLSARIAELEQEVASLKRKNAQQMFLETAIDRLKIDTLPPLSDPRQQQNLLYGQLGRSRDVARKCLQLVDKLAAACPVDALEEALNDLAVTDVPTPTDVRLEPISSVPAELHARLSNHLDAIPVALEARSTRALRARLESPNKSATKADTYGAVMSCIVMLEIAAELLKRDAKDRSAQALVVNWRGMTERLHNVIAGSDQQFGVLYCVWAQSRLNGVKEKLEGMQAGGLLG